MSVTSPAESSHSSSRPQATVSPAYRSLPAIPFLQPSCQGGAKYKFLVTASHATLGVTQAGVVVETLAPPTMGKVNISPASGEAMRTLFTINANGFHDEDIPLVYTFSYRHAGSSKLSMLRRITSSLPVLETRLPATTAGIQVVVDVCDALQACTQAESSIIDVSLVKLEVEDIRSLGLEVGALATNQECVASLSLLGRTLETVKADADTGAKFSRPLCSLHSEILAQCATSTLARMDCTELGAASRLVDFMVNSECRLASKALEEGMRLSQELASTTTRLSCTVSVLHVSLVARCSLGETVEAAALSAQRLGYSFARVEEVSVTYT